MEELHQRAPEAVKLGTYIGVAPEFTTVLYRPGDLMGRVCAIASLIPIAICVSLLTAFLCRRTADDLWVGVGQVVCELVNGIIKLYVRQPRPSSPVTNIPADSFGMPSAHSQYMGYFCMVIIIDALRARNLSTIHRVVRIVSVIVVSVFTAYSRYYLYYHTGPQVTVGFLVGSALAFVWLKFENVVRAIGLMRWGLNLWPCRLMLVKDTPYSIYDEYQEYRKRVDKRST